MPLILVVLFRKSLQKYNFFRNNIINTEKNSSQAFYFCLSFTSEEYNPRQMKEDQTLRVGIVGEIYVKYSPLANNHLEDYLLSEGCEPVVPSLLEFVMYCAVSTAVDAKLYRSVSKRSIINGAGYKLIYAMQKQQIKAVKQHGVFDPPHDFEHLRACADRYINQGVSMGEGWLITAEMAALVESGTENIICT